MKYRLGLDMGATSIGWAVLDIEQNKLINAGVRIFDDGREDKSKESLCVKRRSARGARKLTTRKHIQTQELIRTLQGLGLFPQDNDVTRKEELKEMNPYELRKKALDSLLLPDELGRVFLHLAKRKGFLSNRKDDKKEGGKLKQGNEQLLEAMKEQNARTYGEFLYFNLYKEQEGKEKPKQNYEKPIRLKSTFDASGKYIGGLFPFRKNYKDEFDEIWKQQKKLAVKFNSPLQSVLTDENYNKIKKIIFFQRPLKEAEEGICTFEENEYRLAKAHPLFQEFRIWQTLTNLRFNGEPLAPEQMQTLAENLKNPQELKPNSKGVVTFEKIKALLGLPKDGVFNYERIHFSSDEKGILADTTQNAIDNSKGGYFAPYWNKFSAEEKGKIIDFVARPHRFMDSQSKKDITIEDEEKTILAYLVNHFSLSEEAGREFLYYVDLEADFGALSQKAISKILPNLKEGMMYDEACKEAGYNHSEKAYQHLDKLPYYGEILSQSCIGKKAHPHTAEEKYGKISNATVHVALNQVRYLVNELIDLYGQPFDVAIEYARELPAGKKERIKLSQERDSNEQENEKIRQLLKEKLDRKDINSYDIQKYKIWQRLAKKEIDRCCPFSGAQISIEDLFNGQKIQIEHLIPYSRSLDDSLDNKVLATTTANRYKGNRTPFEAFGKSQDGYKWGEIQKRAKKLPPQMFWRFTKNAMKKFEENIGPIARSLNDTRYMTSILQEYLLPIVREDGKKRAQAVVGTLTSLVREIWNLNVYKNKEQADAYRAVHNHHALDAIVVAAISRGQIEKVSHQLKSVHQNVIDEFKDQFYKFRDPNVTEQEKKELKRKIKDFTSARRLAIATPLFPMPERLTTQEILEKVASINISHKPSLKNIKDTKSTIGQLHEDTAYGLQNFVDKESLKVIFKNGQTRKEKEIYEYIPMFYHPEEKQAYYDAYKSWFVLNGKSATMNAKTKEEKQQKAQIQQQEKEAVIKFRETAQKAFKWFVGGNNFCAEVYEINPQNKVLGVPTKDQGEWKIEIVSNYNATIRQRRGEDIAYWRYKYPNAKRIMSLRRNDMVIATFSKEDAYSEKFFKGIKEYVCKKFEQNPDLSEVDVLFRVKKFGGGNIFLTPHDVAKEVADTKSWAATGMALPKYHARKVHLTFSGRIEYAK